ncbi:MAG: hypothetical protein NZM13_09280, partial [Cyclobacteriaceae bacterium]|nr:hypothetical protein [Cyclobacteriaceae bacterium]
MTYQFQIEQAWKILSNTIDFIRASEKKASILMASQGIIWPFILNNIEITPSISFFFRVFSVLISIISFLFAFLSVNPSFGNVSQKKVLYFGHIQTFLSAEDYAKELHLVSGSEENIFKELSEQI